MQSIFMLGKWSTVRGCPGNRPGECPGGYVQGRECQRRKCPKAFRDIIVAYSQCKSNAYRSQDDWDGCYAHCIAYAKRRLNIYFEEFRVTLGFCHTWPHPVAWGGPRDNSGLHAVCITGLVGLHDRT